jgi:hypothetical protein
MSSAEFVDSNGAHDLSSLKVGTVPDTFLKKISERLEGLNVVDILSDEAST